jgi:predicted dehydrogenase
MGEVLRVGIIGAGSMAQAHAAALAAIEEVRVTAVADPELERARALAERLGARAVPEQADVLDDVDAVWLCTPPFLHCAQALAAAAAGKHVFCEKPMALTLDEADRMIAAARQAGVKLMIGQVLRYYPPIAALRTLVESGELGEVVYCFSRRFAAARFEAMAPWRRKGTMGGGFVLEWGIHEVDALRFLVQRPAGQVYGRLAFLDRENPDFATDAHAIISFAGGITATFDGGLTSAIREWTWGVQGTRGAARAEGMQRLRVARLDERNERVLELAPLTDPERKINLAVLQENRAFIEAILRDAPVPVPGEEGRATLALCLAIHRSHAVGQAIALQGA